MIYTFKGINKHFLMEKFDIIDNNEVSIFVWKNKDNRLGFDIDETGISIVKQLVSNSRTILFPKISLIENEKDIEKKINDFRGVSFWDIDHEIDNLYKEYQTFLAQESKNELFKRYNKSALEIPPATITKWYTQKKYTSDFIEFCHKNSAKFIIWDWSDFGIYFYHPFSLGSIEDKIKEICSIFKIEIKEVNNMNQMPFD